MSAVPLVLQLLLFQMKHCLFFSFETFRKINHLGWKRMVCDNVLLESQKTRWWRVFCIHVWHNKWDLPTFKWFHQSEPKPSKANEKYYWQQKLIVISGTMDALIAVSFHYRKKININQINSQSHNFRCSFSQYWSNIFSLYKWYKIIIFLILYIVLMGWRELKFIPYHGLLLFPMKISTHTSWHTKTVSAFAFKNCKEDS